MSNTFSLTELCQCPDPCIDCCPDCCDGTLPLTLSLDITNDPGGTPTVQTVTLTWNGSAWTFSGSLTIFSCPVTAVIDLTCNSITDDCTAFALQVVTTPGGSLDSQSISGCVCPPDGPLYLPFQCDKTVSDCDPCGPGAGDDILFEVME